MSTDAQLPTDAELTAIYKRANGEDTGKAQALTTQRIFKAMRAAIEAYRTSQGEAVGEFVPRYDGGTDVHWSEEFSPSPGMKIYIHPADQTQAEQAAMRDASRDVIGVFAGLLRESLGALEVSAAVFESDDAEHLESLIGKVKNALNAYDRARAAIKGDAS